MRFVFRALPPKSSLCLPSALLSLWAIAATSLLGQSSTVPPQNYLRNNSFVNWESAHVHPLDITPDGTKLLAINTANNSLEIYTPSGGSLKFSKSIPVGLDPVSVRARTNSEAWVVNVISDSISIVDLTNGIVKATLQTNDEPADVIFAGPSQDVAYVSCAGAKTLLEFSASSPAAPLASIVIAGEQPRALAVDKTGRYVYLAIFESGNGTTVLPGGMDNGFEHDIVRDSRGPYGGVNAPPNNGSVYKPLLNPALPPPIPVSMIVKRTVVGNAIEWLDDNLKNWGAFINGAYAQNGTPADRTPGWDLVDRDVAIIDSTNNSVTYQGGLMNILMAIGVNPSTNEVTVVGTDPTNQIRYEPNLQSTFVHVDFGRFVPGGANTVTDLNPHINYTTKTLATGTTTKNSIGDPRAIAWNAAGTQAYVTGMGSSNVAIIGPTGARLGLINVGQGPTGIILSNGYAYVLNKFDATISTISTSSNSVSATTPLYFDPTPAAIKAGRPILYNTQVNSGLGQAACASCHVDARWDRLAWDLGNPAGSMVTLPNLVTDSGNPVTFHPMKGALLTMTLVDTMQAPALHWRGDRPVLEDFEDSFNTLLGGSVATQAQINTLRSFLSTITLPPNPNRNLDNSYPTALPVLGVNNTVIRTGNAAQGAIEFETGCRSCHLGETNRGGAYIDSDTAFGVGIRNPPTWKNFYKRTGLWFGSATGSTAGFGFQQDGGFDSTQDASRDDNMMAFMMAFNGGYPYEPPGLNATNWSNNTQAAVGKQITLSPSNPTDSTGLLAQLLAIADSGTIGMVAKGGLPGDTIRGWMYLGKGAWQSDEIGEVDYTSMIAAYVASGATFTFTAVPNESAYRIGIDMDGDGILDGDDPQPNIPNLTPVNLAVSGTATSSSAVDGNHTAAQAIDGSTLGFFDQNSILVTSGGTNDWFQEDLGTNAQINLIQIFNRADCCANRLADVSVFVSQVPFLSTDLNQTRAQVGVSEYFLSGVRGSLAQIPMQVPGRYVRVQLNASGVPLQLAEVRIMGYPIASIVNPGTQVTSIGATINLPLQATGSQAGNLTSVSAVNLPPGLSINGSGVIGGTIGSTAASFYATTVTATGPGAGSPSVNFVWNITNGALSTASALHSGAVLCSAQNAICSIPESATANIYYGSGSSFVVKSGVTGAIPCDDANFGTPASSVSKSCYVIVTTLPAVATSCAVQGGTCNIPASTTATNVVFYGAGNSYNYSENVSGPLLCDVSSFGGDPDSGVVKSCFTMPMPSSVGAPVSINLAPYFNVSGIASNGTSPQGGGLDGVGYAYSSSLLSGTVNWSGIPFTIGPANAPDGVSGGTVSLPAGNYLTLNMLATGVDGSQLGQTIVVTYTDGSTSSFVQGFSDWGLPVTGNAGESNVVNMPYRIQPGGSQSTNGPWHVYGYSFSLNPTKTVQSVTLPANRTVVVMAMSLTQAGATSAATSVSMAAYDNLVAIANNGSSVSGISNDGWAYSANLLGNTVSWAGETFSLGAPATKSAAANTTIPLPAGNYANLSLLGTAVYGSKTNQIFTVTYTDGSTSQFTQSLSDWGYPQYFPGESSAVSMPYRVSPSGATQNGPWYLYGYSFALNSSKTVKSITLPSNGNVVVLAIDLAQ